jgi:uncharacterized protein YndB with AHSA1/START domain
MSAYRIVRDYPHPIETVWRALTDPVLVPRWTSSGRGGTMVGFSPVKGSRFKLIAKPVAGWNGIVECEVLEVSPPTLLRYTWTGDEGGDVTEVRYQLEPAPGDTRFICDHGGFTGIGGLLMSKLLGSVRRTMLGEPFEAALRDIDR